MTLLKDVVVNMSQSSTVCTLALASGEATSDQRRSYALVMMEDKLLGILTERDLVKKIAEGACFAEMMALEVMSTSVITLNASEIKDVFTPVNLMRQYRIRHLPVLNDQDEVVGVITSARLRQALPASALLKRRQVAEVMATQIITAAPSTPVIEVAQLMAIHRVSCVVIQISEAHSPQGIITEYDIVQIQRLELNLTTLLAETAMSSPLECLHPEDQLWEVQQKMQQLHVRRLVVVNDQGILAGLITQTSILSVLDPQEMTSTIEMLQQQVEQLQDERVKLLQERNLNLETQVQTSESSLLVCQEKFRATFEQAAVGIAHINLDGYFIAINQRFSQVLGYSAADLLNKHFTELTFEEDKEAGLDDLQKLIRGDISSFAQEKRYYRQDSSTFWGNVTVSAATRPSGESDYLIVVLEDISSRKQAETDLQHLNRELEERVSLSTLAFKASEQRYRMLFEFAPDLLFVLNMKGEIQTVNTAVIQRLGYTKAELAGKSLPNCLVTGSPEMHAKDFESLLKHGTSRKEMEVLCRNGSTLSVDCACSIIADTLGKAPYILVIQRDISDLVQAKAKLKASEELFRLAFEEAAIGMALVAPDGRWLQVNQAICDLVGYSAAELLDLDFQTITYPDDLGTDLSHVTKMLAGDITTYQMEKRYLHKQGHIVWVLLSVSLVRDHQAHPLCFISQIQDISTRKNLEMRLRGSEQQMRSVFEAMHDLVLICTIQDNTITGIDIAPTTPKIEDDCSSDLASQTLEYLWDSAETVPGQKIQQVMATDTSVQFEYKLSMCGRERWYSANISPLAGQAILWVARDITALKQAEKDLFREKELAQVTLESIGDAVITTDTQGNIYHFNPVAEHLTGWKTSETQGRPLAEVFHLVHEETRQPAENPIQKALREDRVVGLANHTVLVARNGTEYAIEDSAAPIQDRDGQVIGAVMVFHDVTHSRNLTRQLSWQASHDPLTGLANRRKFEQILLHALQVSQEEAQQHVLCFLDLDQFKVINDTCGHAAGDEVLRQVSKLLQQAIRVTDVLARLGGDEFAILLHQCPLERATEIAENLRQAIQSFRFQWNNKAFSIGASIGLVTIDQESADLESIVGAADAACYAAKAKGRNRIQVYQDDDATLLQQRGEQQWSVRIKQALEDDLFCLYGQAIVPTIENSGKQYFCEILLRMIDEQNRVVTAGEFIPAAERYNLILEVDKWVISKFLNDFYPRLHMSKEQKAQPTQYMINLSGASVGDGQFLHFLKQQLGQHPEAAQWICFEITETAIISNLGQAVSFMKEIKELGCSFALDDFGAGMSSFAYLKTLPVDYLKIDGGFMDDLADDPATYAIVESINHIGHVMGLQTIAEFVSSVEIREKLQSISVNYVQGFDIELPKALAV
ncbi:PAS domain S-box protein [Acaryochloris thomasi]|nr:PAS domain S-box protein [Acaryochloris thomasi]